MANNRLSHQAAMLLALSILWLMEGTVRFNSVANSGTNGFLHSPSGVFSPLVLLLASLAQVVTALAGILFSCFVLFFPQPGSALQRGLVIALLVLQHTFVLFTFVTWVFAQPSYTIAHQHTEDLPGLNRTGGPPLTLSQYTWFETFGLLVGVSYCSALFGGNVFFTIAVKTGLDAKKPDYDAAYYRWRLVFYSGVVLFGGVFILAMGSLMRAAAGEHEFDTALSGVFVTGPVAVVYPAFTIFTGVFALLLGAAGIVVGLAFWSSASALVFFVAACAFNFLWQYAIMVMLSLGRLGAAGAGSEVGALVLVFNFMPAYMALNSRPPLSEGDSLTTVAV